MNLSQWLLPFKLDLDDRQPIAVLSVPYDDREFALYAPSIIFWVETLGAIAMIGIVGGLISLVSYKYIVQKQGSNLAFLMGYGVIIPLWVSLPYFLVEILDLRNKVMKFAVCAVIPTLGIFKSTEAMYGCAPVHTTASFMSYFMYFSSPMMMVYDRKLQNYVKCSWREIMLQLGTFVSKLTILGAIQSYATPSGMHPFGSPTSEWYEPKRIFNLYQYMDNLVYAFLFQMYLSSYCEGLTLATMVITGFKCETVMENPLMQSKSLTELWSKKWNKLVEGVLKRGVYVPMRKSGLSKFPASLGTFLVSGLFHEWLLTVIFKPRNHELLPDGSCQPPTCYIAPLGGQTLFMLWNALAIAFENIVCKVYAIKHIAHIIPSPILTFIVIAPGIMVTHWFTEPYVISNFFAHGQLSLPMLLPLEKIVK